MGERTHVLRVSGRAMAWTKPRARVASRGMSKSQMVMTLALCLGVSAFSFACNKDKGETAKPEDGAGKTDETAKSEFPDLDSVLASPHRSSENSARDVYRHPKETLEFFGVERNMTVVELWPGGGWYTEVLGPFLRDEGKLIVTNMPADHERYGKRAAEFEAKIKAAPELYGDVTFAIAPTAADQPFELAPEGTVDVVVTFRNSHGWFNNGQTEQIYGAAFRALKPGGIFGIEQHRAAEGANPQESSKQGYLPEALVIEHAQKVGFELVEKSEINANPKDTKDYPAGVWALPPSLSGPDDKPLTDEEKAKHMAIGESDRMTLKFRKPQ
jgi:predicted methyltransferase